MNSTGTAQSLLSSGALCSAIFPGEMPRNVKITGGEQEMRIKVGDCAQFTNYSLAVHAKCRSYRMQNHTDKAVGLPGHTPESVPSVTGTVATNCTNVIGPP